MPTGDMLRVGLTGLAAFQRNLGTIGHNISNVNTPGFSRQRTILTNNDPSPYGNGFIGNGTRIVTTERLYDEHAVNQVRTRNGSTEYYSVFNEFAAQIDNLLADPDAGLAPAIEDFFDAVQGMADDPTSIPAREVMMTQAQAMVDRFETMEDWFSELRKATNDRIVNQVSNINALSRQIAEMNQEIIVAEGIGGGQPANDLLDQRDLMIEELSKHINITVVPQNDGSLNIFMGQGQTLVLGSVSRELVARPDPDDVLNFEVAYVDRYSNKLTSISNTLNGGDLGGILAFREEILLPSQNYLGWVAHGISKTFNDQHHLGIDLNNTVGGDFFLEPDPNTMMRASVYNAVLPGAGGPDLQLSTDPLVTDPYVVADIEPADYRIKFDGTNWTILNESSGKQQNLTITSVGPPIRFAPVDGMYLEIDVPGPAPVADDVFFIRATREAARKLELAFDDPNLIAAAGPLRTMVDTGQNIVGGNRGKAVISEANVTDPLLFNTTLPALALPFTIQFGHTNPLVTTGVADQYSTDGGVTWTGFAPGTNTFTFGNTGTDGWDVTITGEPWVSDQFYVEPNTSGTGDNRNGRALAELQITGTMENGNATYHEAYSSLVTKVGNRTQQAEINHKAQEALLNQAKELRESVSGVNLDEEAANLLRYQQAYAAAAQVIAAADSIFQTLLSAVRR